jgi:hypothetical protein
MRAAGGEGARHGEADATADTSDGGAPPGEIDVHHACRQYERYLPIGLDHLIAGRAVSAAAHAVV